MLKRKIYDDLLRWKARPEKKALVVNGARQVGKTFIIEAFIREQYPYAATINFIEKPQFRQVFEGELSADAVISQMTLLLPEVVFERGKTAILLDEIQACPAAITALKFLSRDGRFDVIATGSMLGMSYKDVASFPVGFVERMEMHSLDFEEFLWANGVSHEHIEMLRDCFESMSPVPPAMHERMLGLFREYIVVGGMPEVVDKYVGSHHFGEVLALQRGIVRDYTDDIAKYAEGSEKAKARECFLSIPKQLSRDYKKFRYSVVEKNGSARKYGGSLEWLFDAGITNFCHNLERIALPFEGSAAADAFKVYMRDTGLLVAMLEDGAQADIISGNMGIYKGALYENIVADIFGKAGKKLYYYEYRSQIEMDFFIRRHGIATAVEVKSADHTKSKSMNAIISNYGVERGIKLSSKNVGSAGAVDTIPLYMAMFL
ncbi:MAG: ATP-binding protein [Clostridiales Family XIII bacterium]|jgi:predicted AAA+ superfamily ATPase|nr:ATP-binding protein [Clostridiales Family XIII bacterium]